MHPSALNLSEAFFNTYSKSTEDCILLDIGAQNINGSIKDVCPSYIKYIGVDFVVGEGVDVVLSDPYKLPFEDQSADFVMCSSVFEHSAFFWKLFVEILRVLKPTGLLYVNAPSNGYIHRYPVDCWRFYPDAGLAMTQWGIENGYSCYLLESFIAKMENPTHSDGVWNDFVAVFIKSSVHKNAFPDRICNTYTEVTNLICDGERIESTESFMSEDFKLIQSLHGRLEKANAESQQISESLGRVENFNHELKLLADSLSLQKDAIEADLHEHSVRLAQSLRLSQEYQVALNELSVSKKRAEDNLKAQLAANVSLEELARERENRELLAVSRAALANAEYKAIRDSSAWKVTFPFRAVGTFIKKHFSVLGLGAATAIAVLSGNRPRVRSLLLGEWIRINDRYVQLKSVSSPWAEIPYGTLIRFVRRFKKPVLSKGAIATTNKSAHLMSAGSEHSITGIGEFAPFYSSNYQPNEDFSAFETDIKAIAFYLPQFHVTEENNKWWGEGFTEWTNTKKSLPRFDDDYQPRIPHSDIGYYDLSDVQTLEKQALLAKQHSIFGFCFYYYWFSGVRLLSKPLDILIEHPEIELNFCLCWANENWTRTWDGLNQDILIEQKYSDSDPLNFIRDIERYLSDARYIKVDGKPLIMVYKAHIIPNLAFVIQIWREWWRSKTGGELEIVCNRTNFADQKCDEMRGLMDGVVEFPPHVVSYQIEEPRHLEVTTKGNFYDYKALSKDIITGRERTENPSFNFYRTVMLGWDNSARRREGWSKWVGFSLGAYYDWLAKVIEHTRIKFPENNRLLFINAWNEWAEGTYLEPDEKYGYSSINTTSRAILGLPLDKPLTLVPENLSPNPHGIKRPMSVAIHAHFFFDEIFEELVGYLARMPFEYDLYVTTDTDEKKRTLERLLLNAKNVSKLNVVLTPNIGRDIAPFLTIGSNLAKYDYIGHFHTKKSSTVTWGDRWRHYLLDNLLGSPSAISSIFSMFERDSRLGIVYPPAYPLIEDYADFGGVKPRVKKILDDLACTQVLPDKPSFPVGNMFWARSDAIAQMLEYKWSLDRFELEEGQVGGTLPHAIERMWDYVASSNGFYSEQILTSRSAPFEQKPPVCRRLAVFVHYSAGNAVSNADLFLLEQLNLCVTDIVFVSNSPIAQEQTLQLRKVCTTLLQRDNVGYDFSAWKLGLETIGWPEVQSYDEVVLINNSCFGPIFSFEEMFAAMKNKSCDFWSVSSFPEITSSMREEAKSLPMHTIPFHLQSYFMVFKSQVVRSIAFKNFWDSVKAETDILEVIAKYECQLTSLIEKAGYVAAAYLPESAILQERHKLNTSFNTAYSKPMAMLKLRSPLLKKKIVQYAPEQLMAIKQFVAAADLFPIEFIEK
jgi:lipopolysaccharide biosynthesis protein/SAM-dependent methyltransferase